MTSTTIPIDQWGLAHRNRTWSTQFNDLRKFKKGEDPFRTYLFELKKQALFEKQTIVRDADLVNSADLLHCFIKPEYGCERALKEGAIVFALREGMPGFWAVNDATKAVRAFSDRYEVTASLLLEFDEIASKYPVATVPNNPSDDVFKRNLTRICQSGNLDPYSLELLNSSITEAESVAADSQLKFGPIYKRLAAEQQRVEDLRDDVLKGRIEGLRSFCRSAHVLTTAARYAVRPSTANDDLDPNQVAVVMGATDRQEFSEDDLHKWLTLWPQYLPTGESVYRMSFERIAGLRASPEGVQYFYHMQATQDSLGTASFKNAYTAYLKALEQYMIAIKVDGRMDMETVDWRREYAQNSMDRAQAKRGLFTTMLNLAPPVIAVSPVADAVVLLTHGIVPFSSKMIGVEVAKAVAAAGIVGLNHVIANHFIDRPVPLKRLLNGTTSTPVR